MWLGSAKREATRDRSLSGNDLIARSAWHIERTDLITRLLLLLLLLFLLPQEFFTSG